MSHLFNVILKSQNTRNAFLGSHASGKLIARATAICFFSFSILYHRLEGVYDLRYGGEHFNILLSYTCCSCNEIKKIKC